MRVSPREAGNTFFKRKVWNLVKAAPAATDNYQLKYFITIIISILLLIEDCFKYPGLQAAADGGCERDAVHIMNEGYKVWGGLKSVLNNRGLGMKVKKCSYEGVVVDLY